MLAILGFGVAGLLFLLFGLTMTRSTNKKVTNILRSFSMAYVVLSCAFFVFAAASALGSSAILAMSVIVGDLLILVATCFICNILLEGNKYSKQVLIVVAVLGIIATIYRVAYFYPAPYMTEGILFFNSQRFVNFILTSIFLLIWFPANIRVSRLQIATRPAAHVLAASLTYGYTAAIFSAVIFILAKTPFVLIMSFTALCICYLVLIISNLAIRKVEETHHD